MIPTPRNRLLSSSSSISLTTSRHQSPRTTSPSISFQKPTQGKNEDPNLSVQLTHDNSNNETYDNQTPYREKEENKLSIKGVVNNNNISGEYSMSQHDDAHQFNTTTPSEFGFNSHNLQNQIQNSEGRLETTSQSTSHHAKFVNEAPQPFRSGGSELRQRRASMRSGYESSAAETKKIAVYSLRTCQVEPFRNKGLTFWMHLFSAILRVFSSLAVVLFDILLFITHKGTDIQGWSKRFHTIMEAQNLFWSFLFAIILFAYGVNSLVFLWKIRDSSSYAEHYRHESIGIRICTLISITYISWVLAYFLSMRAAFCRREVPVLQYVPHLCQEAHLVWSAAGLSLCGLAGSLMLTFFWVGRWFKSFTALAYIRFTLGMITLMLMVCLDITFRNLKNGPLEFEDAQHDAQIQFEIMRHQVLANGCVSGAINVFTSCYSLAACWFRSKYLIGLDSIILFIVFWFQVQFGFALMWPLDIMTYIDDYEKLYEENNFAFDALAKSGTRKHLLVCVGLILSSVVVICVCFVSTIAVLFLRKAPREWKIKKRFMVSSLLRSRSRKKTAHSVDIRQSQPMILVTPSRPSTEKSGTR